MYNPELKLISRQLDHNKIITDLVILELLFSKDGHFITHVGWSTKKNEKREWTGTCLRTLDCGGKRLDFVFKTRRKVADVVLFSQVVVFPEKWEFHFIADIAVPSFVWPIMSEPSKPEAVPGNFLEEDDDDDDLFVSAIQV